MDYGIVWSSEALEDIEFIAEYYRKGFKILCKGGSE